MMNSFSDFLLGPCVRSLPHKGQSLFLTFDDGPDPIITPAVLDLLSAHGAKATFFVIGKNAGETRSLVQRIQNEGHAIGNHTLDHHYRRYFSGPRKLRAWIEDSEKFLQDLTGHQSIGFRPPAGIRTPALNSAIRDLNEPLILWSIRYYDAVKTWTQDRALPSIQRISVGDIVLLHDRQRPKNRKVFLKTLDYFLTAIKERGFSLTPLEREACLSEMVKDLHHAN